MKTYKIGDTIWHARFEKHVSVTQKCPICFGNREVELILGDGTHLKLPCSYCGKGYEEPRGYVREYQRVVKPERHTISRIDSQNINGVETYEYFYGEISDEGHTYDMGMSTDEIFDTEADALIKCKNMIAEDEEREWESAKYLKHDNAKNYSWNAGYHMRIVKQAKKDIEYHTRKAEICKSRAKTE